MKRKSLGFIPLIWECAFCNNQNPGPIKSCTGCGDYNRDGLLDPGCCALITSKLANR